MTETSYPNPGVTQLQHERLLGRAMPSGLLGSPDDPVLAYANGTGTREVRIRADRQAVVEGYGWQNDAAEIVKTLGTNSSGSVRVDLIVLRLNRADWTVTVQVVQGAPGAGVPSPTYNTGSSGVWELPVAAVTVASGATTLASSTVAALAWYLGADGQTVCKSTTRPPHSRGRRIHETDTGRELVSNGTVWRVVGDDATGTIAASSGISHSAPTLHRRNGLVTFALTLWRPNGPLNANTEYSVGNVPDGFRPPSRISSTGICPSNQSVLTYSVGADGAIVVNPGATGVPTNRSCVLAAMTWPHA